jgi:shikimate kinase
MLKRPVFLVGFMGSGKTTWGRRLAHKFQLPFLDTDQLLSNKEGLSINEIFATKGEPYFRNQEAEILENLKHELAIIATGGGLPCYHDNMEKLNALGTTVYLDLPPKALFQRLQLERNKRPLLANLNDTELLQFIESRLSERENTYLQAKVVVKVLKADINSLAQHLLDREKPTT